MLGENVTNSTAVTVRRPGPLTRKPPLSQPQVSVSQDLVWAPGATESRAEQSDNSAYPPQILSKFNAN